MAVKEQTAIRTDKETLAKLKLLAGDKSLGAFLRDIADNNVVITPVEVEVSEVDTLRKSLLKQIESIKITQEAIIDLMTSLNTRIEGTFTGLMYEQENNDKLFDYFSDKDSDFRDYRKQIDASYDLKEQFDSYMDEDEPFED